MKNNGKLIIIHTSITDEENWGIQNVKIYQTSPIIQITKYLKKIYRLIIPLPKVQFWGWQRNNQRYIQIASLSGLRPIEIFSRANQSFIILSW